MQQQHASAVMRTGQASAAQPSREACKQTVHLLPATCGLCSAAAVLSHRNQMPLSSASIHLTGVQAVILDIRFPTLPVAELQRHQAAVNALAWAPHSSCHICTAGDDAQALIWDLTSMAKPLEQSLGMRGPCVHASAWLASACTPDPHG